MSGLLSDPHCIWCDKPFIMTYGHGSSKISCGRLCLANNYQFRKRFAKFKESQQPEDISFAQRCEKMIDAGVSRKVINDALKSYKKGIIVMPGKMVLNA